MPSTAETGTPSVRTPEAIAALAQLNMGRVLRPLVQFATVVSFYLHLREFLSASFVVRYNMDLAYLTLLATYAGHRELRRWVQDPDVIQQRARRGEFFVVFWWAFYYVTGVAANHVPTYRLPEGLLGLCLQITVIFFGTLASQQVYKGVRGGRRSGGDTPASLEDKIRDFVRKAKGPVKRSQLQQIFGVSQPTLSRTLQRLVAKRQVRWTGDSEKDPDGGFVVGDDEDSSA